MDFDVFLFWFQNELFGTLEGIAMHPSELCGYVLGSDCGAPFNPDAMWNVTFPKTPKPPVTPPTPPKVNISLTYVIQL